MATCGDRVCTHLFPNCVSSIHAHYCINMAFTEHIEFADFDYDFRTALIDGSQRELRLPSSLIAEQRVHVKFEGLYTPPSPRLRRPEHGVLAKRRVEAQDRQRARRISRCYAQWRREHPESPVTWTEVRWRELPHPGHRLKLHVAAGEVSPKSGAMVIPERPHALDRSKAGPLRRLMSLIRWRRR
jgi:hypothetical protein